MVSNDLIRVEGDRRFDLVRIGGGGRRGRGEVEKDRGRVWDVGRVCGERIEGGVWRERNGVEGGGGGGGGVRSGSGVGRDKFNGCFGESGFGVIRKSVPEGLGVIDKKSELEIVFGVFQVCVGRAGQGRSGILKVEGGLGRDHGGPTVISDLNPNPIDRGGLGQGSKNTTKRSLDDSMSDKSSKRYFYRRKSNIRLEITADNLQSDGPRIQDTVSNNKTTKRALQYIETSPKTPLQNPFNTPPENPNPPPKTTQPHPIKPPSNLTPPHIPDTQNLPRRRPFSKTPTPPHPYPYPTPTPPSGHPVIFPPQSKLQVPFIDDSNLINIRELVSQSRKERFSRLQGSLAMTPKDRLALTVKMPTKSPIGLLEEETDFEDVGRGEGSRIGRGR